MADNPVRGPLQDPLIKAGAAAKPGGKQPPSAGSSGGSPSYVYETQSLYAQVSDDGRSVNVYSDKPRVIDFTGPGNTNYSLKGNITQGHFVPTAIVSNDGKKETPLDKAAQRALMVEGNGTVTKVDGELKVKFKMITLLSDDDVKILEAAKAAGQKQSKAEGRTSDAVATSETDLGNFSPSTPSGGLPKGRGPSQVG